MGWCRWGGRREVWETGRGPVRQPVASGGTWQDRAAALTWLGGWRQHVAGHRTAGQAAR